MGRRITLRGIIEHEGKFLFVRLKGKDWWCLPGGGMEDGETLVSGLEREIVEELGVKPIVGRLLYVQQLFLGPSATDTINESLEFFFEITNGKDFAALDVSGTTHGELELDAVEFVDPASTHILPPFLKNLTNDLATQSLPLIVVNHEQ